MCGLCWFIPNYDNEPEVETWLYRHFDGLSTLLYVGITKNGNYRQFEHARNQAWFKQVRNTTWEFYHTRKEALDAEWIAIRDENPDYNVIRKPPKHWPMWSDHPKFVCKDSCSSTHSSMCISKNIMRLKWHVGKRHDPPNPECYELIFR